MTEEKYRREMQCLIYDAPDPEEDRPNWPRWRLPQRKEGESYESHLHRLRKFKEGYFERVRKLEEPMRLTWL